MTSVARLVTFVDLGGDDDGPADLRALPHDVELSDRVPARRAGA